MLFIHSLSQKSSYKLVDWLTFRFLSLVLTALWDCPNPPIHLYFLLSSQRNYPFGLKVSPLFLPSNFYAYCPLPHVAAFSHSAQRLSSVATKSASSVSALILPLPLPAAFPATSSFFLSPAFHWHIYWDSHVSLWALSHLLWPASRINICRLPSSLPGVPCTWWTLYKFLLRKLK